MEPEKNCTGNKMNIMNDLVRQTLFQPPIPHLAIMPNLLTTGQKKNGGYYNSKLKKKFSIQSLFSRSVFSITFSSPPSCSSTTPSITFILSPPHPLASDWTPSTSSPLLWLQTPPSYSLFFLIDFFSTTKKWMKPFKTSGSVSRESHFSRVESTRGGEKQWIC